MTPASSCVAAAPPVEFLSASGLGAPTIATAQSPHALPSPDSVSPIILEFGYAPMSGAFADWARSAELGQSMRRDVRVSVIEHDGTDGASYDVDQAVCIALKLEAEATTDLNNVAIRRLEILAAP